MGRGFTVCVYIYIYIAFWDFKKNPGEAISHAHRSLEGLEPEKLDKDCIRDWVKARCDPYNDEIPEVDNEIIQKVYDSYSYFYNSINSINEV